MTPDEEKGVSLAHLSGTAEGAVEGAEHAVHHAARQIVLALANGGVDAIGEHALAELATRSEAASGAAVRLFTRRVDAAEARRVHELGLLPDQDDSGLRAELQSIVEAARALADEAEAIRRALPPQFGDPLGLDR